MERPVRQLVLERLALGYVFDDEGYLGDASLLVPHRIHGSLDPLLATLLADLRRVVQKRWRSHYDAVLYAFFDVLYEPYSSQLLVFEDIAALRLFPPLEVPQLVPGGVGHQGASVGLEDMDCKRRLLDHCPEAS